MKSLMYIQPEYLSFNHGESKLSKTLADSMNICFKHLPISILSYINCLYWGYKRIFPKSYHKGHLCSQHSSLTQIWHYIVLHNCYYCWNNYTFTVAVKVKKTYKVLHLSVFPYRTTHLLTSSQNIQFTFVTLHSQRSKDTYNFKNH